MNTAGGDLDTADLVSGSSHLEIGSFSGMEPTASDCELNYRLLFEANPQPMWVYDIQSLSFLAVNDAAVNNYGYSRSEFLGMTLREIRSVDDVPELLSAIESTRNATTPLKNSGTRRHRTRDGRTIDVEITSQSIEFAGRSARLVLATDVTEQRRTEEARLNSEAKFRLLFESIPLPVFVFDQESLQVLEVNEAAISLYGYTHSEFLELTAWNLRPVEDFPKLKKLIPSFTTGPDNFGVRRHLKKDGTVIYVDVTSYSLMIQGRKARVSVVEDVTERWRRESEWDALSEIIQGTNYTSNLDELLKLIHSSLTRVVYADNFFVTLYDENTGLFNFPFFADKYDSRPQPRKLSKSCTAYVFKTGKPLLLTEQRYRELLDQGDIQLIGTHSPSWLGVPLKTPAKTIGVLVLQHYDDENAYTEHDKEFIESVASQVALAIERKHAEEALRETNQTLQEIIQAAPLAIAAFEPDGKIQMWNAASERIFGWTAEEAMNGNVPVIPEDRQIESQMRRQEIINGGRFSDFETQRLTKDGRLIDVSISAAPLSDSKGATKAVLTVVADISERKRSEAVLRHTEDQLRQSQKMEAIGQLAGGVAHDFNNLLTAIIGYSELLLGQPDNDEMLKMCLNEIKGAGDRAAALTGQLLAFSRKQVLQPTIVELNSIVANTDKMLRRLIGEDIKLTTSLQPDLGRVKVDPGQIEQVIMNLAVNARDAMPNGGSLTIETANLELDETSARHIGITEGRYVTMSVSDSGFGMDAETQSHIFEPFFTTKEVGKGTGLGLSTVYGIVNQSGGKIEVHSEVGVGTTFTIYLPRHDDPSEVSTRTAEQKALPKGTETILLVEDEDVVRTLVSNLLSTGGYKVLTASGPEEAIRISGQFPNHIHMLLSDVVMPNMNGPELGERLLQSRPEMKILLMSGYTGNGPHNLKILGDTVPLLQKPFSLSGLSKKIREVIDGPSRMSS